jgi:Domain of unknown function (DUF4234)
MDTYELIHRPPAPRPALPKTFWWAAASVVLMPIGAFGPWATVLDVVTFSGTDGNAGWTIVGAAAIGAIAVGLFVVWRRRWLCLVAFFAAAAGAATAAYNINDISSSNTSLEGADLMSTEWGIYVALAGSIGLLLASLALGIQTESGGKTIVIPGSTAKAKLRRPWGVFALSIVTFGLYHLYWYYQANRELKDYGVGTNPVLSLVAQFPGALLIVPPFVSWWRFFGRLREAQDRAGCAERVDHTTGIVLYLIAFFLLPFELVYAQKHLDSLWREARSASPVQDTFANPAPVPPIAL